MTLTPAQLALVLVLTSAAGLGGYLGYRHWRKVQARRRRLQQVAGVAFGMMQDVLVPDGSDGHLHLDFLLLTSAGLLVVDLRDVPGMIFGSESMDEWTVSWTAVAAPSRIRWVRSTTGSGSRGRPWRAGRA